MRQPLLVLFCYCLSNAYAENSDGVTRLRVAEDGVQETEQHAALIQVAQQLVAPGKGLLAADESTTTMGRSYALVMSTCAIRVLDAATWAMGSAPVVLPALVPALKCHLAASPCPQ